MYRERNIETQETQILPTIPPLLAQKPTLKELRLSCGMRREQLSQAAGVRLCRVDWMERGIETGLSDALKVLLILSRAANYWYRIEDIRGLRIKAQPDDHEAHEAIIKPDESTNTTTKEKNDHVNK